MVATATVGAFASFCRIDAALGKRYNRACRKTDVAYN